MASPSPALAPPCDPDVAWQRLRTRLPANLRDLAFQHGALYRERKLTAELLLRLLLLYANGLSLPAVAAWAAAGQWVHITPEALCMRLQQARHWLAALVGALLAVPPLPDTGGSGRLLLVDGTHATRPGARSQDWRAHLALNLRTATLEAAHLTAQTVGESFQPLPLQPGDLVVGDRNYGRRPNLWQAVTVGAHVLVRFTAKALAFQTRAGTPFDLGAHVASLAPGTQAAWDVWVTPSRRCASGAVRGQVIAYRLTAEQAIPAARHHRRRRQQSGRAPASAATAHGWEYVLLFTTLPADRLSATAALTLYRMRWQIEMAIKRYKSLGGLATLHTRTDASCQAVLWAKLLLILLMEACGRDAGLFPP